MFTDNELLAAISRAIQAKDMPAAAALIRLLAVQSPDAAQLILDALRAGYAPNGVQP